MQPVAFVIYHHSSSTIKKLGKSVRNKKEMDMYWWE
jgi:hypothetical protein